MAKKTTIKKGTNQNDVITGGNQNGRLFGFGGNDILISNPVNCP